MNDKYSYENIKKRLHSSRMNNRPDNRKWYWVASTAAGKTILLSPAQMSESLARTYAQKMLGGNLYEIVELHTKDQTQATRAYRAKLLEKTKDIPFAISRMSHKVPQRESQNEVDDEQPENEEHFSTSEK